MRLREPPLPVAWTGPDDEARAAALFPAGKPVIALGPTANGPPKVWPADRFADLFQALAGGPLAVHDAIEEPYHLSYPYLLELDGRLYCVPETHQAREVALYELERFPDRWRRVTSLLSDIVLVDATPFNHGGLWWLAGSEAAVA